MNNSKYTTAMHSGDMGDVIYSIPTLKALGVNRIVLNTLPLYGTKMGKEQCEALKPLLEKSGFNVIITDNPNRNEIDYDMDMFRSGNDLTNEHLAECHAKTFGVLDKIDWINKFINPGNPNIIADVVINRTIRYQNMNFDWFYLLNDITAKIVFIGTKAEYDFFRGQTLLTNVAYYPTSNLIEAARVIAGAKVYIGNQSTPYAIAEGLKQNRIQETCLEVPNCKGLTDNAIDVTDKTSLFFAKSKLHNWLNLEFNNAIDIPKKIMLYTTSYCENDYHLDRINSWVNYYSKKKEELGYSHICIIDDGSPKEWLSKINNAVIHETGIKTDDNNNRILSMPAFLPEGKVNIITFKERLGRPSHFLFPGWWRSYSFGAKLCDFHKFDKFIFIESDCYLISKRVFNFLKNIKDGLGSFFCKVSDYRETNIQWCSKSEYYRLTKYFMDQYGNLNTNHWYSINLHSMNYVPELCVPFTNDTDVVKQFIGDRYGDDHFESIPNGDIDYIANTTDISLNGKFHKHEAEKFEQIKARLTN